MSGIDPHIVEHDIHTYKNSKHVQQNLRPVNPRKVAAKKDKVEKLLKTCFIYSVPLSEWVSNLILVDKRMEPYVFVWISMICTKLVRRTTSPHLSLTKLLMSVWEVL
jgi:hypothetical protein